MNRRTVLALGFALLALSATGCSRKYRIHVESDTCWQGSVNRDLFLDDCNSAEFEVKGKLTEVSLTKKTAEGVLRVWIDDGRPGETSEPFGTVIVRN